MRKVAYKALYLFLCSILGIVLFTMLHRAIFVLYDILLFSNFSTFSFGLSSSGIAAIDFFTMLIAVFIGGWYGTLLGMDWYSIVYGPNAEKPAGLFHGFLPHHMRKGAKAKHTSAPTATSTFVNIPVVEKVKEWSFDDFLTPKAEPKKKVAVKRTGARKTVRKATTKRVTKAAV